MSGDSLDNVKNSAMKKFRRKGSAARKINNERLGKKNDSPNCPQYFTVSTVHVDAVTRRGRAWLAREVRREILNFRFRFCSG